MRSLAPTKAHFDFHFMTFFQETPRRPHADLQIVLVGARSQADLLYLRDMLVLLRVTGALILFESVPAQVGDATYGRIRRCGNFDEVKAGFFGAAQGVLNRKDSDLLAVFVDDADLRYADLAIGAWTGWDWGTRVKWSTGYGCCPRYFFFGPLLTIGGLGAAFVRLPPRFDMCDILSAVPTEPQSE